jgi:hypothetical protein
MSEHEIELDDLGLPPPWPNVGVMLGDLSRSLVHQRWHDAALAHLFNAGAISAGEVFRLTTHTCMGMQELVERWRHEIKLNFKSEVLAIRDLDPFDFIVFMEDAHTWLVDPARTLPAKGTVGSLLGDAYPAFLEQSEAWLESVLGFGEDELPGEGIIVISMLALVGVPSTWWGAPQWPEIVNEFLDALDDPNHQHWLDFDISPNTLPPQPAAMKNRRRLRKHLLDSPWTIDTPSADWMLQQAGLEFLFTLPQPTEEELAEMERELAELVDEEQSPQRS